MTRLKWAAVPLALILCAPASAGPQTAAPELVVTAAPREVALAKWSQRVEQSLEQNIRYPHFIGTPADYRDMFVEVSFVCSEDGTPDQVAIARSSGNNRYDQAALSSVRRIKSLHPMADGMSPGQAIKAQVIYLSATEPKSDRRMRQRTADLRKQAAKRNVWFTQAETASNSIMLVAGAQ
jgi:TonB family protein